MNPELHSARVKEIFEKAIEFTSTDERRGYINRACNGDSPLLARVQTLLRVHFESGDTFLPDNPREPSHPMEKNFPTGDTGETTGAVIGRYKLLQKIGEGGCGVVWMAEQAEPVRRCVALKEIKLGMDTKPVIACFEAERQGPHIAKVLGAGATESSGTGF